MVCRRPRRPLRWLAQILWEKGWCVVFLLTASLGLSMRGLASPWPQAEGEDLFARAVQLQQAGDLEGAIRAYRAFLELNPGSVEARSNLGAAYAHLGQYQKAVEEYRRSLELDGGNATVRFNLGLAYYKAAQVAEAATELARAVAAQPRNLNAAILLADCYLRMGENKKVVELLSPFEATHRDDRALLYVLGTALIRDKQVEKGQLLVDRILRDGDSAEARMMLGTARIVGHDYAGAVKEFRRALELNAALPAAYSFYGMALMNTGNRDQAADAFQRELQFNPTDFAANFYLGFMLKQDQKFPQALRYLERALQLQPAAPDVRYQIGSLHVSTGNLAVAERVLEELVKDQPNFVEAHVSLAMVYYRLRRKQDGDRQQEIIRKLNAEIQARASGAREGLEPAYRGEVLPEIQPVQDP